jgi:glycine cleavage system transcriptional repressor
MTQQIIAVTVLGDDRPGIVADVTAALADLHGNLEDSTMTLLRGHFAMVLLVRTGAGAASVEAALKPLTARGSLVINARVLAESSAAVPGGPAYSLRVHGADRPGIVATITRVVAQHGANIVDLGTRLGGGLYVLTAELQVPDEHAAVALERDLTGAAAELGVEVHLSPVDDDVW